MCTIHTVTPPILTSQRDLSDFDNIVITMSKSDLFVTECHRLNLDCPIQVHILSTAFDAVV